MDLRQHLLQHGRRRSSARRRSPTPWPRLGLAVHFGYAGLLNMGIAGLHGHRRLRLRDLRSSRFGLPVVGRRARRPPGRRGGLRAHPRHPDPAPARRLPRHRDDRGRPRCVRLLFTHARRSTTWTDSADGLAQYHGSFRASNPIPAGRPTASARGSTPRPTWWVRVFGLITARRRDRCWCGRSCAARGDACSRASARTKTRCAHSARTSSPTRCRRSSLGGMLGAAGGIVYALPSRRQSRAYYVDLAHVLRLDRSCCWAAPPPCSGRSSARSSSGCVFDLPGEPAAGRWPRPACLPACPRSRRRRCATSSSAVALMLLVIFTPAGHSSETRRS